MPGKQQVLSNYLLKNTYRRMNDLECMFPKAWGLFSFPTHAFINLVTNIH